MSYILDALKKSDQQRQKNAVPDLQTVHPDVMDAPESNKWLYALIIFLLVCLAFLIGYYQPWSSAEKEKSLVKSEASSVAPPAEVKKNKPVQVVQEKTVSKMEKNTSHENTAHIDRKPVSAPAVASLSEQQQDIRQIPRLTELPAMVQQAIPNMVFAGHVYSSSAEQRSIIINGYSMSEGDVVVAHLKVKQITPDGVIFDYQGQLFRVEILQDWSFD